MVICLVFLILATISAPVVPSFALGQTTSHRFGVFGLCEIKSGSCTKAAYPYTLGDIDKGSGWTLAPSTRNSLSKIFILCPIGAGLSLITLLAILVGHCVGSVALILAIVFNAISFIIAVLVCVIVIVVFNPNVAWTGWILIGLAVASLFSLILLVLALKFHGSRDDADENEGDTTSFEGDRAFGVPNKAFDEKFSAPRSGGYGDDSSFKQSYQFTVQKPQTQVSKTLTNSSVYNSNPQLAKDFTVHDRPSNLSLGRTGTASSSFYDELRVNLVNGPNTPVVSNKQMAPNVRPEVAQTQMPAPKQPPYPAQNPLDKRPYNPTDMSVFEHHPEVEGHRPFTELPDDEPARTNHNYSKSDEMDSDADSDFTSVSQRAPNPNYQPQMNYFPPPQQAGGPVPYGGNPHPPQQPPQQNYGYSQGQQYAPQFVSRPAGNFGPPPSQNYAPPMHQQLRGPTVSENILSQNPDVNFARTGRRGHQQQYKPGAARINQQRNLMGNRAAGFRDSPYGGF